MTAHPTGTLTSEGNDKHIPSSLSDRFSWQKSFGSDGNIFKTTKETSYTSQTNPSTTNKPEVQENNDDSNIIFDKAVQHEVTIRNLEKSPSQSIILRNTASQQQNNQQNHHQHTSKKRSPLSKLFKPKANKSNQSINDSNQTKSAQSKKSILKDECCSTSSDADSGHSKMSTSNQSHSVGEETVVGGNTTRQTRRRSKSSHAYYQSTGNKSKTFNDSESVIVPLFMDNHERLYLEKAINGQDSDIESRISDFSENEDQMIAASSTSSGSSTRKRKNSKIAQDKRISCKNSEDKGLNESQQVTTADAKLKNTDSVSNVGNDDVSAKSKRKFLKNFPEMIDTMNGKDFENILVEVYNCAYDKDILWQGKLYLTMNHIAFHSKIFGRKKKVIISYDNVVSIEKKMSAGLIPNNIRISTNDGQLYCFTSFLKRDSAYTDMFNTWKSKSLYKPPVLSMASSMNAGYRAPSNLFAASQSQKASMSSILIKQQNSPEEEPQVAQQQSENTSFLGKASKGLSLSFDSRLLNSNYKKESQQSRIFKQNVLNISSLKTVEEAKSNQDISQSSNQFNALNVNANLPSEEDKDKGASPSVVDGNNSNSSLGASEEHSNYQSTNDLNKPSHPRKRSYTSGKPVPSRATSMSASMNDFFKRVFTSGANNNPNNLSSQDLLVSKLSDDVILIKSSKSNGALSPQPVINIQTPKTVHINPIITKIQASPTSDSNPYSSEIDYSQMSATPSAVPKSGNTQTGVELASLPVQCNCATHPDKQVLSQVINMSVDEVYSKLFADLKGSMFVETQMKRGSDQFEIGEWKVPDQGGHVCRDVKYQISIKVPIFGKQQSPAHEKQILLIKEENKRYIIETVTKTPKVPYGDTFSTVTRYCLTYEAPEKTRFLIHMKLDFIKKPIWKDKIEAGAFDGTCSFQKDLVELLTKGNSGTVTSNNVNNNVDNSNTNGLPANLNAVDNGYTGPSGIQQVQRLTGGLQMNQMSSSINSSTILQNQATISKTSLLIIGLFLMTTFINTYWIVSLQRQLSKAYGGASNFFNKHVSSSSVVTQGQQKSLASSASPSSSLGPSSSNKAAFNEKYHVKRRKFVETQKKEFEQARQSIEQIHHQLSSMNNVLGSLKHELKGISFTDKIEEDITYSENSVFFSNEEIIIKQSEDGDDGRVGSVTSDKDTKPMNDDTVKKEGSINKNSFKKRINNKNDNQLESSSTVSLDETPRDSEFSPISTPTKS